MIIDVGVVIDIGDIHIGDVRSCDVDAVEVTAAHAVPRNIRFTKAQGAPTVAAKASTEADTHAPSGAAKPRNQRGSVVRTHIDWSRRPPPIVVVINPSAVVERSVAPRLIVNPSPSPRINPDPVSIAIRGPTYINMTRNPHIPVFSGFLPSTVFIEIFIANYIRRNISRRSGVIEPLITITRPLIKVVGRRSRVNVGIRCVGAVGKARLLTI